MNELTSDLGKVLRKKKPLLIVCSLCKGPIVLVKEQWVHLANTLEVYHSAVPAPEGVKPVTLKFSSLINLTCTDFLKTLRKTLPWVGASTVKSHPHEGFIVDVAIDPKDIDAVMEMAGHQGLFTGSTPKAGPRIKSESAEAESAEEGGNTEMAKAKKAAKKSTGAATKSRSKAEYRADSNYRECKSCGHFVLKTKWDRHIEKHPECKSQTPKAKKATAKKAKTKAKGKTAKKASKKGAVVAQEVEAA